ncbi:MAG: DUF2867 domain-containing protein [Planctomycetaceae bacterium]|jgi:hypothetical protein|nr:DUF2867 domain-containing protein [Planctomycetaceae bacterium]
MKFKKLKYALGDSGHCSCKVWMIKKPRGTKNVIEKHSNAPENSTIFTGFETTDYCDSYRITKLTDDTATQVMLQFFKLPKWANGLLSLRNLITKPFGLKTEWGTVFPIIDQNGNEVLMGVDDKHLNFRVSVLIDRERSHICITTAVHYNNRWGKMYFLIIKPFHRIIVHSMIKRLLIQGCE